MEEGNCHFRGAVEKTEWPDFHCFGFKWYIRDNLFKVVFGFDKVLEPVNTVAVVFYILFKNILK
jgi:hypothetical protein